MSTYDASIVAELLELHEQPGPAFVEHINAMAAQLRAAASRIEQLERALRELIERPYDGEGRNLAALDRARAALSTDQGHEGET